MAFVGEHSCTGCGGTDAPRETCSACGVLAIISTAAEGWTTINAVDALCSHSFLWCSACWRAVLAARSAAAPPLQARALTREGRVLLQRAADPAPVPPVQRAWQAQQRHQAGEECVSTSVTPATRIPKL